MYPAVPPRKATLMTIHGPLVAVIRAMQKDKGASSGFLLFESQIILQSPIVQRLDNAID